MEARDGGLLFVRQRSRKLSLKGWRAGGCQFIAAALLTLDQPFGFQGLETSRLKPLRQEIALPGPSTPLRQRIHQGLLTRSLREVDG